MAGVRNSCLGQIVRQTYALKSQSLFFMYM